MMDAPSEDAVIPLASGARLSAGPEVRLAFAAGAAYVQHVIWEDGAALEATRKSRRRQCPRGKPAYGLVKGKAERSQRRRSQRGAGTRVPI
jgi:hypothetical protein